MADLNKNLLHMGGPLYYGSDCRALLNFNQSLCESWYRDAQGFCDCFCPTLQLLQPGSKFVGCEAKIMRFLLFGRRSPALLRNFSLEPYCARLLCDYFAIIGDPAPPYPTEGVPSYCSTIDLPWRTMNCVPLVTDTPYNPQPWDTPYPEDNVLQCSDKTTFPVDIRDASTWTVCSDHNFRWRCPKNFPIMCSDRNCADDNCCQRNVTDCDSKKQKSGSLMLLASLPEWEGRATPEMILRRGTKTTTLDPYQEYLNLIPTTAAPISIAEKVKAGLPIILGVVGSLGCVGIAFGCFCIGRNHFQKVKSLVIGPTRLMNIYNQEPAPLCVASGKMPKERRKIVPPERPWAEIEAERLDNEACQKLQDAFASCELRGLRHVVTNTSLWPLEEELPLRQAMALVRGRRLQDMRNNMELLKKGETWLRVVEGEYDLMKAVEDSRPELLRAGMTKYTSPPLPGIPWHSTTMGKLTEGEIRKTSWRQIEVLSNAIQVAKDTGASHLLLKDATDLLQALVARTPELPADRCVLDPEGEGVKLLPMGQQRAVWPVTGDVYMYDAESGNAGDIDSTPPREKLGRVDVDDARPVCAEWAKHSTCKAGRRCPWRHTKPQAGDSIRECIIFDV